MINNTIDSDGIATLEWDLPGRSQNVLNEQSMAAFAGAAQKALADPAVKGILVASAKASGGEQTFTIEPSESVNSVSANLQEVGLIRDAESFRAYLIYSGLDTSIQAGEYRLSAAMSAMDIARELQDAASTEVEFVILPGWRMEEIAASLPTSGLSITPEEFVSVVQSPSSGFDYLAGANSAEGFLFPDSYILARNVCD